MRSSSISFSRLLQTSASRWMLNFKIDIFSAKQAMWNLSWATWIFAGANKDPWFDSKWCISGIPPKGITSDETSSHAPEAPKYKDVSPSLRSFLQWFQKMKMSAWTPAWILLFPEKHHLPQTSRCTRHHVEPDLDGPCSWIWRLWAWRLSAVVPGQFGSCDGKPPSCQLGGDSQ